MKLDVGQHQRLQQTMKLAPRMIQSMEILQMSTMQLEERIAQELANNPTLEPREVGPDRKALEEDRKQSERDSREGERALVVTESDPKQNTDDFERLNNISEEYSDAWRDNVNEGESYRPRRDNGERNAKMDAMANTIARQQSITEQLMEQWHLTQVPDYIREAGDYLLGFIDNDGYLRTDRQTLIDQRPHNVDPDDLDAALDRLQKTLEPVGLAARDLRECLLLQIDYAAEQPDTQDLTIARLIVSDYLKDVEANRLPQIAKATNLSIEQIKNALISLRQFDPRPGRQLVFDVPQMITPDAIIEHDEIEDRYYATLTRGRTPSVQVSRSAEKMAGDKTLDRKTRNFVSSNLTSARWLLDAIAQRQNTLLRVINVVIEAQRDFFDQGPQALHPLPMTQVADQLGIHVATVSRAVNEKYIQSPQGIHPLRMFFSGGTETESGDQMSWAAVQARLKELIDQEDKKHPLSDDALVEELKKVGIELARRTVAKYRKQLNIPTARQRREY